MAQRLGKERADLENIVNTIDSLENSLTESLEFLKLAEEEDNDEETIAAVLDDLETSEEKLSKLEFRRMFSGDMDANNAFVDIQSGSGGTEALDWADMLLRMYLRWGEKPDFKTELLEVSPGDVAGIKSATIR